jgi:hypothetical protein
VEELIGRLAGRRIGHRGSLEQVGVEPPLLEPGRAEGAARGDHVRGEQALEVDLLDDHRVALGRGPALRRRHEALREGAAGAQPRGRARGRAVHRAARALRQVEVLEVVAVVRPDRVRMRHEPGDAGRADRPRGRARWAARGRAVLGRGRGAGVTTT